MSTNGQTNGEANGKQSFNVKVSQRFVSATPSRADSNDPAISMTRKYRLDLQVSNPFSPPSVVVYSPFIGLDVLMSYVPR